jgi:REP element-mobilizing transposase RayT
VYHITLNSRDRIHSFGEIKDGEMHLSELGQALKQYIESSHEHYPYAEIPIFQIMPDHVHLLVTIHQAEAQGQRKDDACIVQSSASTAQSLDPKMKKVSDRRGYL